MDAWTSEEERLMTKEKHNHERVKRSVKWSNNMKNEMLLEPFVEVEYL